MNKYSTNSQLNLDSAHDFLQIIFKEVLQIKDHSVIEGYRNETRQNELFFAKKSQVEFPNSNHNVLPARAVDVIPYPYDESDFEGMALFAGVVLGVAHAHKIPIRWGGDWNRDYQVKGEKFRDMAHFELAEEVL